jgi:ankyrin repeat protein
LLKEEALTQDEEITPLHVAAFANSVEAVELLLASGFDVMAENKRYETPLHLAAQVGNLPVVSCLLRHGASDSFDVFGTTARTVALELGLVEIVNHLDEASKSNNISGSPHRKRQKPGRERNHMATALERAVRANDYESMELLISTGCPIDLRLPTNQGGSALILAMELEKPAVVEWFLEHGASVLSAKHTNGVEDSVIEIASARTTFNTQLGRILQKYWWQGGDLNTDEDFPFHDAVWNGNMPGLEILINESKKHLEAEA